MKRIQVPTSLAQLIDAFQYRAPGSIRLVGGCVRDSLAGKPVKDWDLATQLLPENVKEIVADFNRLNNGWPMGPVKTVDTGLKHGTITVVWPNGDSYEITTLRIDRDCDGRHAEVEFTTDWEADAARRDFTMNAMSYDWDIDTVYDYFNGERDLKNGIIRFVGIAKERIQEDYLRILRYFRFAAKYDLAFDEAELLECFEQVDGLKQISTERKISELKQIFSYNNNRVVKEMKFFLFPALGFMTQDYKDKIFPTNSRNPLIIMWKIWFHSVSLSGISLKDYGKEWKLKKEEIEFMEFFNNTQQCFRKEPIEKLLLDGIPREWIVEAIKYHGFYQMTRHALEWEIPILPVKGGDFLAKGYSGKDIGDCMRTVRKEWIDSKYKLTREELLERY